MNVSMRLWWCLVGLMLAAPASIARAQEHADPSADVRVVSIRPSLESTLAAAETEGLPSAWLRDKVAEGLAKHAPPARILQAVEALHHRMRTANAIEQGLRLREPDRTRRLLRALVDALSAGTLPHPLEELARRVAQDSHARETVRLAVVTVAELAERQLNPNVALELASAAYRNRGAEGLAALRRAGRTAPAGQLESAARRVSSGQATVPGMAADRSRGRPGGPPHDNAFGQGHGRSESRGMRP